MKIPFLNKKFPSSFSSNSNSSLWKCHSCHQNPRTISFRATIIAINPIEVEEEENDEGDEEDKPPLAINFSSASTSSTTDAIEELPQTESIENVIKGIRSSKRLIFELKGESNSILEEIRNKDSCPCPWNPSTLSLISSDSWWRLLRYTHFTTREVSKCTVKTTK